MHIVVIAASGSALEKRRGGVSSPFITFFFLLFLQKTKRKIKHRCHGTAACTSPGALPPRGAYAPAGQEGLLRSIFHRRAHGYCVLYEQARPAGGGSDSRQYRCKEPEYRIRCDVGESERPR